MVVNTTPTLIMDNGGHTIKIGWATGEAPRIVPNCMVKAKSERKRVFIGDELNECTDKSSLFFLLPCERGYLVNWDTQQQIWEKSIDERKPENSRVLFTHPNCIVPAVKDESTEILFEIFAFNSIHKTASATLIGSLHAEASPSSSMRRRCCVVVDCGYSFTHIVPYVDGRPVQKGIIRLDVGGKLLTNQLKEWISYRQLNVVEETYVMGECKEDACFVSLDYHHDMRIARLKGEDNTIVREYVLPDFMTRRRGELRMPLRDVDERVQKITLNIERFTLPEILFNPCDAGIPQKGLAECIVESISRCPYNMHSAFFKNIYVFGGSTSFPNFKERLLLEIRCLVDPIMEVCLAHAAHSSTQCTPVTEAWHAGKTLVNRDCIPPSRFVTRAQYAEEGENACRKAFIQFARLQDSRECNRRNE